jgi:hypothetical protein
MFSRPFRWTKRRRFYRTASSRGCSRQGEPRGFLGELGDELVSVGEMVDEFAWIGISPGTMTPRLEDG